MKDDEQIEGKLYEAATHWLVSERADTDAWKLIGVALGDCRGVEDAKLRLGAVEMRIKADFGLFTMPVRWRSAKSTILAAMKVGVSIIDSLGLPKPKTALSKQTKDAMVMVAGIPTPMQAFDDAMVALRIAYSRLGVSDQAIATLKMLAVIAPTKPISPIVKATKGP